VRTRHGRNVRKIPRCGRRHLCQRERREVRGDRLGAMSDTDQDAYDDYERKLLDNVDEHGWFCVHVFDPDGREEPFSYSVGFTKTLGAPEFIVFGLPRNLMHSMLWEVFRQIKAGKTPADNQRWSNLIEGF